MITQSYSSLQFFHKDIKTTAYIMTFSGLIMYLFYINVCIYTEKYTKPYVMKFK